jgi:hypothetical protein
VFYVLPLSLALAVKYTPLFNESHTVSDTVSNTISKAKAEAKMVATNVELFLKNVL